MCKLYAHEVLYSDFVNAGVNCAVHVYVEGRFGGRNNPVGIKVSASLNMARVDLLYILLLLRCREIQTKIL